MTDARVQLVPSGFFVLRTPLMPIEELTRLAEPGPDGGAADEGLVRRRLVALARRPEVAEALYIASPSLTAALERWREAPESRRGRKVERSLLAYVARMCSRATPFGLFAGYSVGSLAAGTRLILDPRSRYERRTRVDFGLLHLVATAAERTVGFRDEARYRPSSSIYPAAGRLHYVERLTDPDASRSIAAVAETPPLKAVLTRAGDGGASRAELAELLVTHGAPVDRARAYVDELIDVGILDPGMAPSVTGPAALPALAGNLKRLSSTAGLGELLDRSAERLARLDRQGLGSPSTAYETIATEFEAEGLPVDRARLLQVDLFKPAPGLELGEDVTTELLRGVDRLRRLALPEPDQLAALRERFVARYEQRTVGFLEAFDDEAGLGLDTLPPPRDVAGGTRTEITWGERETLLLERIMRVRQAGGNELVLADAELRALPDKPPDLPGALAVMASLVHDPGRPPLVLVHGAFGPSGARMLGRFCDADPELRRLVQEHLLAEEATEPDAIFAEIAHLPAVRLGNVVRRPVLRRYEIDYLGPSGAPAAGRIPLTDLLVSVENERFVLRSRRLGRRVLPRLASAVSTSLDVSPVFRLLGMLQSQGVTQLSFDWGPLAELASLPRVRVGRTVLAPARWRIALADARGLTSASGIERRRTACELRESRQLPRLVAIHERGTALTVDLDNPLSADVLGAALARAGNVVALEMPSLGGRPLVTGPEGAFAGELLVPFTRRPTAVSGDRSGSAPAARPSRAQRSFPPGSEWSYAKLYGGAAATERLLCERVAPLCERLCGEGVLRGWHFVRYADPHHHVRVRMRAAPGSSPAAADAALQRLAADAIADGRLWRLSFDTYERELERYAGPEGIEHVEAIFHADSVAVATALTVLRSATERLEAAALGVDELLASLGLDASARRDAAAGLSRGLLAELGPRAPSRAELARTLRARRAGIEAARCARREGRPEQLAAALSARAAALGRPAAMLREHEAQGRLAPSLTRIATSVAHMHVNRMLRRPNVRDELLIFDWLAHLPARGASLVGLPSG